MAQEEAKHDEAGEADPAGKAESKDEAADALKESKFGEELDKAEGEAKQAEQGAEAPAEANAEVKIGEVKDSRGLAESKTEAKGESGGKETEESQQVPAIDKGEAKEGSESKADGESKDGEDGEEAKPQEPVRTPRTEEEVVSLIEEFDLNELIEKKEEEAILKMLEDDPDQAEYVIDEQERLPLHAAAKCRSSLVVLNALLKAFPKSVKETDFRGRLPLHFAAEFMAVELIEPLVEAFNNFDSDADSDEYATDDDDEEEEEEGKNGEKEAGAEKEDGEEEGESDDGDDKEESKEEGKDGEDADGAEEGNDADGGEGAVVGEEKEGEDGNKEEVGKGVDTTKDEGHYDDNGEWVEGAAAVVEAIDEEEVVGAGLAEEVVEEVVEEEGGEGGEGGEGEGGEGIEEQIEGYYGDDGEWVEGNGYYDETTGEWISNKEEGEEGEGEEGGGGGGGLQQGDKADMLPLHLAAASGRDGATLEMLNKLIEIKGGKAALEKVDRMGRTPLHWLCCNAAPFEVTGAIADAQPTAVNMQDKMGRTPLHWLLQRGEPRAPKVVLEAELKLVDKMIDLGTTAAEGGQEAPSMEDERGMMPLHHAVECQASDDVIRRLLRAHGDAGNYGLPPRFAFEQEMAQRWVPPPEVEEEAPPDADTWGGDY
jgi:ankyrin repeat protein